MRAWLYSQLTTHPDILALFAPWLGDDRMIDRVYQSETLSDRLVNKPYLVYSLGNETDEGLSEDPDHPSPTRQFFTIYVYDKRGDYTRIDEIIPVLRKIFRSRTDPASKILLTNHLETSTDMDDDTLGTILRYMRFQAVKEG